MSEQNDEIKREKVRVIPINLIDDFPDHPLASTAFVMTTTPKGSQSNDPFYGFDDGTDLLCG